MMLPETFNRLTELGYVRMIWEPDYDADLSWADAETLELAERDGCWGLVGQYRVSESDAWRDGDSVWGLVGQYDSGCGSDIADQTVESLKDALRSRCRTCRRYA